MDEVIGGDRRPTRRSFLRWAGSKRKLIPRLEQFWDDRFSRYVEPFAGSACLFFSIAPDRALLGDNNAELINVYRTLRSSPERIHRRLVHIPRDSETYYRWRAKDPKDLDKETRALRFIYLNHNCFNGIYRTNVNGQFNVPFGSKLSTYLSRDEFFECAGVLADTELVSGDFQDTLARVERGATLALEAGVTRQAVSVVETDESVKMDPRRRKVLEAMQRVLEDNYGIEFFAASENSGEGVRFRK